MLLDDANEVGEADLPVPQPELVLHEVDRELIEV